MLSELSIEVRSRLESSNTSFGDGLCKRSWLISFPSPARATTNTEYIKLCNKHNETYSETYLGTFSLVVVQLTALAYKEFAYLTVGELLRSKPASKGLSKARSRFEARVVG
jgi:hypothetical protein